MNKKENEEYSIKDLILTLKSYLVEIVKGWKLILVAIILFTSYFSYFGWNSKPTYNSQIKFFIDGNNNTNSPFGGILGQFGYRSGSGNNNPYQVLEVANSRNILLEVLLSRVGPEEDFLINILLKEYDVGKIWAKGKHDTDSYLFHTDKDDEFTVKNRVTLIRIFQIITTGNKDFDQIRDISFEEEKGFFTISTTTLSEETSFNITKLTYNKIREYYENKTQTNLIATKELLKTKLDSLNNLVKNKMYELNQFGDQSMSLLSLRAGTKRDLIQKEITGLTLGIVEVEKQYQLSDFNLRNRKDQFLLIEEPFLPLIPSGVNWILVFIKGITLGLFLSIVFITLRKIYIEAMDE